MENFTPEVITAVLLAMGWAASEVLSSIPAVKSNSVFQLIRNAIGGMLGKKDDNAE